jgi:hypothetical protein
MEEQYLIPQIKKLLSTLIFNKVGIEFDVEKTFEGQFIQAKYILTIKINPETAMMAGDNYNPEMTDLLYNMEDIINNVLRYIGLDNGDVEIEYEIIKDEKFLKRIRKLFVNVLPSIYEKYPFLPKMTSIHIHPRSKDLPEIELLMDFERGFTNYSDDMKLYSEIRDKLPMFDDIYITYNG